MWSIIAVIGLIGIVLIARLWVYADDSDPSVAPVPSGSASNESEQLQPDSFRIVHYRLRRWDMFACSVNFCLHNRLVQGAFILGLVFLEWTVISNTYAESIWPVVVAAIVAPLVV